MKFSVLIAHYNNSRYLKTAVDSVFAQTYENWEIILVDDCSTDDFDSVVAGFMPNERIKILKNQQNEGCGFTKRKCAEHASGDIAGFLDPDDALHPTALKVMVEAHHYKKECALISSTHYICNAWLSKIRIAEYTKPLPDNTPYLLVGDGSIHHFVTFKMNCYKKTSGISPNYLKAVDQDLYYKLEETGSSFFINIPLYYYRIHNYSISNAGNEQKAILSHYAVIEEACKRRITALKKDFPTNYPLTKKYKARLYKIKCFNSFKKRKWVSLIYNVVLFSFGGGFGNMLAYVKKLPREGLGLIRQSFQHDNTIRI